MKDHEPTWRETAATLILSGSLIALIVMVLFALSQPAEAGENLCDEYARGWELGICWRLADCTPPPVMCPMGLESEDQAYMAGLRAGLESKKVTL